MQFGIERTEQHEYVFCIDEEQIPLTPELFQIIIRDWALMRFYVNLFMDGLLSEQEKALMQLSTKHTAEAEWEHLLQHAGPERLLASFDPMTRAGVVRWRGRCELIDVGKIVWFCVHLGYWWEEFKLEEAGLDPQDAVNEAMQLLKTESRSEAEHGTAADGTE